MPKRKGGMEIKVDIKLKGRLAKELIGRPEEFSRKAIWSGLVKLVEEIEARAVKEAPVRTSNLVNSITSDVSPDGKKAEVRVTAPYAEFVHRGTGIFGPYKQRIFPIIKKALFWPGASHPVKSIKGMKPNPFFDRAIKKIKPQNIFGDGVWEYIRQFGT